jgi:ketosteroid isomerase-like protein
MHAADVMKDYEARINQHDFDLLLPLIAEDAVFWFTDGSHVGLEAARRAFEEAWSTVENEVYNLSDVRWLALGDSAASCVYSFYWKGMVSDEPVWGEGRGTTVLRRDDEGWKIVHEHLSAAIPSKTDPA